MILQIFLLLSIDTEVAGGVASGAVDRVEMKMNTIGTTVSSPAPSSKMGGIASGPSSIGGSGASGKNGSSSPLT